MKASRFAVFVGVALSAAAVVFLGAASSLAGAFPGPATTRLSVHSFGTEGNAGSQWGAISADGRYIAFESGATNLVNGDTNGVTDVLLHDRGAIGGGLTFRVSLDNTFNQAWSGSFSPSVSGDGRYVAFVSGATTLVAGDTNAANDVFVRDRTSLTTTRASVNSAETQGNDDSFAPSISGDARFVAFSSLATNLAGSDTNTALDVYVRDLVSGTTTRASQSTAGTPGGGDSSDPSMSGDGRYVAFESFSNNLVGGDTNGREDIFVRDLVAGTTSRVSVSSAGVQAYGHSEDSAISSDGRYVAFASESVTLTAGDTNGMVDIFVHDRVTGATARASLDSSGTEGNGQSRHPSLSADGRYVAFESQATNLVSGDTSITSDIFVRDRLLGTTVRVSVSSTGTEADKDCNKPSISADGQSIAFDSRATNLVVGDSNNTYDVFVHDLPPDVTAPGPVGLLKATAADRRVNLSWINPNVGDFAVTRILRSRTGYSASPTPTVGQTQVYEGAGAAHLDTALTNGVRYYYSAYARDLAWNWSARATTTGRPPLGRAALTLPGLSTASPLRYRYFYVKGWLTPRHPFATSVRLAFYRRVGGSYRRAGSIWVGLAASKSDYRLRWRLPAGRWYVVASHACGDHGRTVLSPKRFFVVR
jgi:Tol biopolymer transport system component